MFIYSFFYVYMKNKIPKLVENLLKKYGIYFNCCDICDIKCCNGTTMLKIDNIWYTLDKSGKEPLLVVYSE